MAPIWTPDRDDAAFDQACLRASARHTAGQNYDTGITLRSQAPMKPQLGERECRRQRISSIGFPIRLIQSPLAAVTESSLNAKLGCIKVVDTIRPSRSAGDLANSRNSGHAASRQPASPLHHEVGCNRHGHNSGYVGLGARAGPLPSGLRRCLPPLPRSTQPDTARAARNVAHQVSPYAVNELGKPPRSCVNPNNPSWSGIYYSA
jgi:hypothetical protein